MGKAAHGKTHKKRNCNLFMWDFDDKKLTTDH